MLPDSLGLKRSLDNIKFPVSCNCLTLDNSSFVTSSYFSFCMHTVNALDLFVQ